VLTIFCRISPLNPKFIIQKFPKNQQILKISYLNFEGLAKPIRLMFKIAQVEFEDHRFSYEEFATLKPTFPNSQVPVLVNKTDDMVMTKFNSILKYLCAHHGMYISDPKMAHLVDEIMEMCGDFHKAINYSYYVGKRPEVMVHYGLDAEAKTSIVKIMREDLCKLLPGMLANLDNKVGQTGFLATGIVTIADLLMYCKLRDLKNGFFDHVPKDIAESHANLGELYAKVEALTAVKAHYGLIF
jgi:glutathione S-transferase